MTHWFMSDWHLFHGNMFKTFRIPCPTCGGAWSNVCSGPCMGTGEIPARPFSTEDEMNEFILTHHNQVVKTNDHFHNLGDVTMLRGGVGERMMIREVKKYNGHGRLVLGNHDHCRMEAYREAGFEKIKGSHRIDNLLFTHFPLHPSSIPKGCVNVHGHIHTNPAPPGPYINISIEAINYVPITLEELQQRATLLLSADGLK